MRRLQGIFAITLLFGVLAGCGPGTEASTTPAVATVESTIAPTKGSEMATPQTGYAPVNGLRMYYEIHGSGQPLVLLHGAYMAIDSIFGALLPTLAKNRQVIAVELQAHGRTADIDRPLSYEQMADVTAGLLQYLKIENADFFGYSMGGSVALQVAIRHPAMVRKLVVASTTYKTDGWHPEVLAMMGHLTPDIFAGSPVEEDYQRLAPTPEAFPTLVAKLNELDAQIQDWPAKDMQSITAPTLLIMGDSDSVRPEHAVEMFKLLGGGVVGDLSGLPNAQLAVLPGTTHITLMAQTDLLLAIVPPFLDAPMPVAR
jgi:pimeloyl-ACP methyl ester carboxylesterase